MNNIPLPDIFKTNFLVFYKNKTYKLSEERKKDWIKIYNQKYGLEEIGWDEEMKDYYKKNKKIFIKQNKEFLKKFNDEDSAINYLVNKYSIKKYEEFIYVDNKIYDLITVKDFVSKFKDYFNKNFYEKLEDKLSLSKPRIVSKYLRENEEEYYGKDLNKVCDKVWTNERTVQIFLNNEYMVHLFKEDAESFINNYKKWIELKTKMRGVKKYGFD